MSPQNKSSSRSKGKKDETFFDILKTDHDKVRDLFERITEDEEGESREELFAGIRSELQEHLDLEEKFYYPVLEGIEAARDKALESYEEHHVAKMVLTEFNALDMDDERWDAKLKVLRDVVEHHMMEEEKEIFKLSRKVLEPDQINQITDQIRQQKGEIEKKAA